MKYITSSVYQFFLCVIVVVVVFVVVIIVVIVVVVVVVVVFLVHGDPEFPCETEIESSKGTHILYL